MTLKSSQGYRRCGAIQQAMHHFLSMVCSNVAIVADSEKLLQCTCNVTACDLQKSFDFDAKVEITSRVRLSNRT